MEEKTALRVSWSMLATYEECHHKAKHYMAGRRSPVADGRIFLPGTLADRAMRRWLEEPDPQPGGMLKYIDELFEEHTSPATAQYKIKWRGDPVKDRQAVFMTVREGLEKLEPILQELVLPYDYQPELRFTTTIGIPGLQQAVVPITMVGGIDLVVRDVEGNFRLHDLKLTRNDAYVRGKTMAQLTFYSIAFAALMGLPDQPKQTSFITPLCKEKVVPVYVGVEERRVMMARIVSFAHGVWRKEWKPTEKMAPCGHCDVKHACDKFNLPAVKDAQGRARVSFEEAVKRRGGRQLGIEAVLSQRPDGQGRDGGSQGEGQPGPGGSELGDSTAGTHGPEPVRG